MGKVINLKQEPKRARLKNMPWFIKGELDNIGFIGCVEEKAGGVIKKIKLPYEIEDFKMYVHPSGFLLATTTEDGDEVVCWWYDFRENAARFYNGTSNGSS